MLVFRRFQVVELDQARPSGPHFKQELIRVSLVKISNAPILLLASPLQLALNLLDF